MTIVQNSDVIPWNVSVMAKLSEYQTKNNGITFEEATVRKFSKFNRIV
jgi:hypothetical protein